MQAIKITSEGQNMTNVTVDRSKASPADGQENELEATHEAASSNPITMVTDR